MNVGVARRGLLRCLSGTLMYMTMVIVKCVVAELVVKVLQGVLGGSQVSNATRNFMLSILGIVFCFVITMATLKAVNIGITSLVATLNTTTLATNLTLRSLLGGIIDKLMVLVGGPFISNGVLSFRKMGKAIRRVGVFSAAIRALSGGLIAVPGSELASGGIMGYAVIRREEISYAFSMDCSSSVSGIHRVVLGLVTAGRVVLGSPRPAMEINRRLSDKIRVGIFT